jgi:hypothetical protein
MDKNDTAVDIQTLGRFSISLDGKAVATDWPDETVKVLFCSLLAPLDLYVTWDRVCRSMCGEPATQACRHRLDDEYIRPLNSFLIKELGFNPIIAEPEGMRINQLRIHMDAFEFHSTAIEGLRLLSLGNHPAALEKLSRAKSLYKGIYLPEIQGKIISSTRKDLESLYQIVVTTVMQLTRESGCQA